MLIRIGYLLLIWAVIASHDMQCMAVTTDTVTESVSDAPTEAPTGAPAGTPAGAPAGTPAGAPATGAVGTQNSTNAPGNGTDEANPVVQVTTQGPKENVTEAAKVEDNFAWLFKYVEDFPPAPTEAGDGKKYAILFLMVLGILVVVFVVLDAAQCYENLYWRRQIKRLEKKVVKLEHRTIREPFQTDMDHDGDDDLYADRNMGPMPPAVKQPHSVSQYPMMYGPPAPMASSKGAYGPPAPMATGYGSRAAPPPARPPAGNSLDTAMWVGDGED